jgi:hypothetical protein
VQPPSPDSQVLKGDKKVHGNGVSKKKGFVASTAAKKKRPLITRRQSSQSSTEQNVTGTSLEKAPTGPDEHRVKGKTTSRFQENFSPDQAEVQSSKTSSSRKLGKGKEVMRRSPPLDSTLVNADMSGNAEPGRWGLRPIEKQKHKNTQDLTEEELNELELQHTLLAEAKARMERRGTQDNDRRKSVLSGSGNDTPQPDLGAIRMLPHDAKGKAKVGFASTEAAGQLQLSDTIPPPQEASAAKGRSKGKGHSEDAPKPNLFVKRAVPSVSATATPTPPTASGSLARSKSQLTFLLEKDRARNTDKSTREGGKK